MSDETEVNISAEALEAEAQADAQEQIARAVEAAALEAQDEGSVEPSADEPDRPDLEAENLDLKDKLLRAMAEADNTRRIAAREKQDASKYAVTNFARDILRVADNLGFAMMSVTEEARQADQSLDNLYVGIDMTMKELLNVFEAQGIKPVAAKGAPFDHNIHEAVQQVENPDVPAGTVMQALRGGFTIQDRLLRPAQVVVSTGGPARAQTDVEATETAAATPKASEPGAPEPGEPGQSVDQET